ncbi:hypothetical protein E2C01_096152 [Portunus trituberculatus]|uniref:Uncharacterized protein n=1 Tax=Portunus trituberculatus TaxID=210409 RepID=A0A5B7K218_PORTR|nr:hypothetical protein [Portunus trituberculatus]
MTLAYTVTFASVKQAHSLRDSHWATGPKDKFLYPTSGSDYCGPLETELDQVFIPWDENVNAKQISALLCGILDSRTTKSGKSVQGW